MNGAQAVESSSQPAPPAFAPRGKTGPRPKGEYKAQRDMLAAAIYDGMSAQEAAKLVGVTIKTAAKWAAEVRRNPEPGSREKLINKLNLWLNHPSTPIQYRAPLATLYANLHRWLKDDGNQVTLKPLGEVFDSWRAEISATMPAPSESNPAKPLGE